MTSDRRDQLSDIYHRALERPAADRRAFVKKACAGDEALREEVESLLRYESRTNSFLETPAGQAVAADNLLTGDRQLGPYTVEVLDDARFAPGRIFARRYRIVSLLGRGAMGEVYRADDLRLGQPVALKLMSEAMAGRHDGLQRLTDEVRLARTIVHPNVCRVYDIGHAEGWHYLSMEYVDGETLASLLRRVGQPSRAKGLEMARQLCAGLGSAHARGVLHRDMKPTNIMIDGRGQVRILDFGLAVTAADDVREVAGTPAYMSPEQHAGERLTVQSDLYALGRVLTELLPADIDADLSRMIEACLARDPAKRPQSAYAIAALITGDPFVLLEGGVPTSAMVAAAPTGGSMKLSVAWLLLATSLAGSVAIASRAHLINVAPSELPMPPEVLAERARQMAATRAPSTGPIDRAFWWWDTEDDTRIQFTYRESRRLLVPANLFREVTAHDPPVDSTASVIVTFSADGTPSTATEPIRDVWNTGRPPIGELLYWIIIPVGLMACAILARRNLRAGAGDRKGAWRLSLFVCCSCAVGNGLRAHHVPSVVDEAAWLIGMAGWSLLWGTFGWLAYISSEPYVRKWWPRTLVSWARLLEGRVRDPLVGRHVLVGAAIGVLSAALLLLQLEISGQRPVRVLRVQALESLASPATFGSLFIFGIVIGLLIALIGMALFVIVRLIVRRTSIAATLVVMVTVPLFAAGLSPVDVAFGVIFAVLGLTVLLRIGLLAHVAALMVMHSLTWMPLTLDGDAWYFGWSLLVLLAIVAYASYGFLAALGGQPAFGSLDKHVVD